MTAIPVAITGVNAVSNLLNSLGPSHTKAAISHNELIFDQLGQQAAANPNANAIAFDGSRTTMSAMRWLSRIVGGPGFQGGPGTPFPANPRDFLEWGPNPTDPNRRTELDYANEIWQALATSLIAADLPPVPEPTLGPIATTTVLADHTAQGPAEPPTITSHLAGMVAQSTGVQPSKLPYIIGGGIVVVLLLVFLFWKGR